MESHISGTAVVVSGTRCMKTIRTIRYHYDWAGTGCVTIQNAGKPRPPHACLSLSSFCVLVSSLAEQLDIGLLVFFVTTG